MGIRIFRVCFGLLISERYCKRVESVGILEILSPKSGDGLASQYKRMNLPFLPSVELLYSITHTETWEFLILHIIIGCWIHWPLLAINVFFKLHRIMQIINHYFVQVIWILIWWITSTVVYCKILQQSYLVIWLPSNLKWLYMYILAKKILIFLGDKSDHSCLSLLFHMVQSYLFQNMALPA